LKNFDLENISKSKSHFLWSLGWYISIYMHDICTYSTSKCIRNPLRNNLQGYIHTSDFKFQDINLQKWPKTPKICMKKKFHPEKKFISNFDVLKHPDLFLTKKIFFGKFVFSDLRPPSCQKKKF
jgi:hypothetical protein